MPEQRWAQHCRDTAAGSILPTHSAIRKYGRHSFVMEILSFHNMDDEMLEAEKKAIMDLSSHISTGKGYNATWGGSSLGSGRDHPNFGKKLSEETKKKISEAALGKGNSSYKHAGEHHWNRGLVRSEETKEKIRVSLALRPRLPRKEETKKKLSAAFKGRPVSEEQKQKISNTLTGRPRDPEAVRKGAESNRGRKRTDEQKARIRMGILNARSPGGHTRWHINRNIVNPDCPFCKEKI